MVRTPRRRDEKKRLRRLSKAHRLAGVDLCACGGSDRMRCDKACRQVHLSVDGSVICGQVYQFDPPKSFLRKKDKSPKRSKPKDSRGDREKARTSREKRRNFEHLDREVF